MTLALPVIRLHIVPLDVKYSFPPPQGPLRLLAISESPAIKMWGTIATVYRTLYTVLLP